MSAALYLSGWSPPGIRKDWDRCSMDTKSSTQVLQPHLTPNIGAMTEAVAWFGLDGDLRCLVADFDTGRRIIHRRNARNWSTKYTRTPDQ